MILLLVGIPVASGLTVLIVRRQLFSKVILTLCALAHLWLTFSFWREQPPALLSGWFALDQVGLLFLTIASLLNAAVVGYTLGYLRRRYEERAGHSDSVFVASFLFFLASMTLVTLCQHFEMLWVAIEATTLASAPLIYFHRSQHSIEATWKYLMICSIGIALALFGNFFIAISAFQGSAAPDMNEHASMVLSFLLERGKEIQPAWLKAGMVFLFVGYGTKMGLAPMHTWLPDAHSEAPSPVSALLSGALLNCAFLGILRGYQVCIAAGQAEFAQDMLLIFGLLSMAFAAVFVLKQTDFKRMLAYSSVEHMGILSLSVGLGGTAIFGGLFHSMGHSFAKGMLFLVSGNILSAYRSKSIHAVGGLIRMMPFTAVLWFAGVLAVTGAPPFSPFISELLILKAAVGQNQMGVAILYLVLLAIVFIAMLVATLKMVFGAIPHHVLAETPGEEKFWSVAPPVVLALLALVLGIWMPPALSDVLHGAARLLGGS